MKKKLANLLACTALLCSLVVATPLSAYAGRWEQRSDDWYYVENGKSATGWKKIGSYWYFFNDNGTMRKGWLNNNGTWYFLNADGVMKKGWARSGGKWYYLFDSGEMAHDCWITLNSRWYYLTSDGSLLTNGYTPDGYRVNQDGEWIG